jgi:hypothetical protein
LIWFILLNLKKEPLRLSKMPKGQRKRKPVKSNKRTKKRKSSFR